MRFGIAGRVTLLVVVVILSLGLFLGGYFSRYESRALLESLDERTNALLSSLATNLQYPLLVGDRGVAARLVNAALSQPDVVRCTITGDRDSVLFAGETKRSGPLKSYQAPVSATHTIGATDEGLILGTGEPVTEVLGTVTLTVSLAELNRKADHIKHTISAVVIAATILASLLCFLLLRFMLGHPIATLVAATRRIARGELTFEVPAGSRDEMGALADAFNSMTADLRSSVVSRDYVDKIINSMNDALIVATPAGVITRVNKAARELLGGRDEDYPGRSLKSLFAEASIAEGEWLENFVAAGGALSNTETTLVAASGERIPVLLSGAVMNDGAGRPEAVVCVALDIRDLKRAEEEIRTLSSAVEQSVEGVGLADRSGNLTYANNALAAMHRLDAAALRGVAFARLLPNSYQAQWEESLAEALTSGSWSGEMAGLRQDGATFPTALSLSTLKDAGGGVSGLLVHVSDVTSRKELEMQLLQAQKLDSIGQLAGGVAHDFNNMLGAISGYADMIRQRFGPGNPSIEKYATRILDAARRSADLTAKLLAFARKGKFEMAIVNMHAVVQDVVGLLEHTIDRRIAIVQVLGARPSTVMGDRAQLQNAVLNLAVNARDAMPEGGRLVFSTDVVDAARVPRSERTDAPATAERYIMVSVTDTGIGMDELVQARIFEPFFTTKDLGKGTGLGLASVYGTVRSHNGFIDVTSAAGKGSTFTLYLPVVAQTAPDGVPLRVPPSEQHAAATILFVDDEEIIRSMALEMLGGMGYSVHTCVDGGEAIAYYREHHAGINLVILDIVMPHVGGFDCFAELKKINPALRALVSSGYSVNEEARRIMDAGALGFIHKPFDVKELARSIEGALRT
jgi:PAS domain S-box-containing protein